MVTLIKKIELKSLGACISDIETFIKQLVLLVCLYKVYLSIECQRANNLCYNKGFINTARWVFRSLLMLQTLPREIYNSFTGG